MLHRSFLLILLLASAGLAAAQVETLPSSDQGPGETQAPPRSDRNREAGESSSRDTRIDISPPKDDAKNHPYSGAAVSDANADASPDADVQEFHPWDPHKAAKDVEVGDYYFKRKNYRAALDRYREALVYKDNDAVANYRMAQCLEKLNQPGEARTHYEEYLKILPHGEYSADSQKKLAQLKASEDSDSKK
jgi:tetratricopeptide (TPR) repeat protein